MTINHQHVCLFCFFSRARKNLYSVHAQFFIVHDRHDQDIQNSAQNDDGRSAFVIHDQENTVYHLYYVNIHADNLLHQTSFLLS